MEQLTSEEPSQVGVAAPTGTEDARSDLDALKRGFVDLPHARLYSHHTFCCLSRPSAISGFGLLCAKSRNEHRPPHVDAYRNARVNTKLEVDKMFCQPCGGKNTIAIDEDRERPVF